MKQHTLHTFNSIDAQYQIFICLHTLWYIGYAVQPDFDLNYPKIHGASQHVMISAFIPLLNNHHRLQHCYYYFYKCLWQ